MSLRFKKGLALVSPACASSEEAQALREALYQIRRKQKIVTIRGLSTGYGHEFTNRSEKMYSESQSRKAKP